jgi:outer membrane biosynthesis protein TonB
VSGDVARRAEPASPRRSESTAVRAPAQPAPATPAATAGAERGASTPATESSQPRRPETAGEVERTPDIGAIGPRPSIGDINIRVPTVDRDPSAAAVSFGKPNESAAGGSERIGSEGPAVLGAYLAPDSPMPVYPPALVSQHLKGKVTAEFVVDENGHADASTFRVLHSDHDLFTNAVRAALPRLRLVPAEANGRPTSQRVVLSFNFAQ